MAENKPPDVAPAPPIPPANESESARTSRGLAEAMTEAEEKQLDETVEGGRYLIGADAQGKNGTLVDANGKPVKD